MACVLTIGNFDGVHLGHQAILAEGRRLADAAGVRLVAMSFDRHPAALLKPEALPPRLMTLAQRVAALKQHGADDVVVMPLTEQALQEPAEAFVKRLVQAHAPVAFAEGPDFHFGHKRQGNGALLQSLGQSLGFDVSLMPPMEVALSDLQQTTVSSSLTRWLLGRGRVEDVATCLGRPFALTGTVVQGEQRGRTIGVPTANLQWDQDTFDGQTIQQALPCDGVYAGRVEVALHTDANGQTQTFDAAISVGVKPTFGVKQLTIEAHLFGLPEGTDLYGQPITMAFHRWIRPQMAFPTPALLVAQIHTDLAACQAVLSGI